MTQTRAVVSDDDLVISSDANAAGAPGDLVFKTGGVERARITVAGVGSGLLGGSQTFLPASNGVDDTAAIQAILTAGGNITGKRGETYTILSTLTIYSNTRLEMTGCTINLVGSAGRLLRNNSNAGAGARDSNVTIIGGTWTRDATVSDAHLIELHRIDRVRVKDARVTTLHGKYGITISDGTDFIIRDITGSAYSSIVQVQGPLSRGLIENISGSATDDFVAVGARDYAAYEKTAGGGDVTSIVIRNLTCTSSTKAICHVFAGVGVKVRDVLIDGVFGTTTGPAVSISEDTLDANTVGLDVDGITVRNVNPTAIGAAYGAVLINGAGAKGIVIDGVKVNQTTNAAYGVLLGATLTATSITVRNLELNANIDHKGIGSLTGSTVTSLTLDGYIGILDATKANGHMATIGGTVSQFKVSNASQTGGADFLQHNGSTALVVQASNIYLSGVGAGFYSAGSAALTVHCGPVVSSAAMTLFQVTSGSGALVITGGPFSIGGTSLFRSSTQSVRVNSPTFSVDISKLTPAAGDYAINSAAASGVLPGTGLVNYDGTTWRLASIGAVKSGTATLVAGTVTVADTAITANSTIRLSRRSIGGTPGALYISALTAATSFAITSTNAADTSVVYYEIVTY